MRKAAAGERAISKIWVDVESLPALVEREDNWWRSVLPPADLRRLYAGIQWDHLVQISHVRPFYQNFQCAALLVAHTLPYVLPIPSERALYRQLMEREVLQDLCGFRPAAVRGHLFVPTRATLWHFRRKFGRQFGKLLGRALTLLAVRAEELALKLPFVSQVRPFENKPAGRRRDKFRFGDFKASLYQGDVPALRKHRRVEQSSVQIPFALSSEAAPSEKSRERPYALLPQDAELPFDAFVDAGSGRVRFSIASPEWLYVDGLSGTALARDPLARHGPAYATRQYSACNVLVIRGLGDDRQVLLGKRLNGYGAGTYAAPGGKKHVTETLFECATRELREETGLSLIDGAPVSFDITREQDKPVVRSIGVLASRYHGNPTSTEPWLIDEWRWYPLDSLPSNLFFPTALALDAYFKGSSTWPSWIDVDEQVVGEDALTLWDE